MSGYNGDRPSVLVVDDELAFRFLVREYLDMIDVTAVEAENGAEALDKLKQSNVRAIVADIMMPVMSGFEMLERVKSNERTRALPVIMVTANSAVEMRDRSYQLGASSFFVKPLPLDEFLSEIRRCLH